MKKRNTSISFLYILCIGICFFLSIVFIACSDKNSGKKSAKESPPIVWQKIKVTAVRGDVSEVSNPEIDYSEDKDLEDFESFGIRIKEHENTITFTWDSIQRIEITGNKSTMFAKITSKGGENIQAELVPDSREGLRDGSDTGKFKLRLKDIKQIDVMH